MTRGAALTGALLATLVNPATWPLALAAFLLRGGIILVLLPIVVVPTPVGLGNAFAPMLTAIAFGSISSGEVILGVGLWIAVFAWLILGGWVAAVLEIGGMHVVAADEDVRSLGTGAVATGDGRRSAARILTARLLAFVPLAIALVLGAIRIVIVAYRELTSPLDVSTPIVARVLLAAPEVVVAVLVTWMAGEIVGGLAARRIALDGDGVGAALHSAIVLAVRHPLLTLVRFWLPTGVLVLVLVPGALAAAAGWTAVAGVLASPPGTVEPFGTVALFVTLWGIGLVLISVICAWRAAVWTVADVTREGTFGGSPDRRPGDWRPDPPSATL